MHGFLPTVLPVENKGGKDTSQGILHHVLVGVPFIALGAEECLPGIAAVNLGVNPLDQFPEAGNGQDEDDAEYRSGSDPVDQSAAPEQLRNGNAAHAYHKVGQAVVVVALEFEQIGDEIVGRVQRCSARR